MNFQEEALNAVRVTLKNVLAGKEKPILEFENSRFKDNLGVFVTLKKQGQLRGCIGFIRGVGPLGLSIQEMAVNAAKNDTRFPPVTLEELQHINIEISVLTPMIEVSNINEIEIGKDGLMLLYGVNSGLLLPQVASELHWNIDDFLINLCLKAGLPPGSHKLPGAKLLKFSAEVFSE